MTWNSRAAARQVKRVVPKDYCTINDLAVELSIPVRRLYRMREGGVFSVDLMEGPHCVYYHRLTAIKRIRAWCEKLARTRGTVGVRK